MNPELYDPELAAAMLKKYSLNANGVRTRSRITERVFSDKGLGVFRGDGLGLLQMWSHLAMTMPMGTIEALDMDTMLSMVVPYDDRVTTEGDRITIRRNFAKPRIGFGALSGGGVESFRQGHVAEVALQGYRYSSRDTTLTLRYQLEGRNIGDWAIYGVRSWRTSEQFYADMPVSAGWIRSMVLDGQE